MRACMRACVRGVRAQQSVHHAGQRHCIENSLVVNMNTYRYMIHVVSTLLVLKEHQPRALPTGLWEGLIYP
jgi:hypothetical protein